MKLQILTNAVKDNDRIVDRVPDDGKQRRDKGRINLPLRKGEHCEHNDNIVDERKHRRHTEAPFEAVGDIEDDESPRNHKCEYGVCNQLAADGRANLLLAENGIGADILRERRHDFLALLLLKVDRADHDVLGGLHRRLVPRELDCAPVKIVFRKARTHIGERHRLLEAQVNDCAARKVDAKVEPTHAHADKAGDDEYEREKKPAPAMSRDIKLRHSSHPPSSLHRA